MTGSDWTGSRRLVELNSRECAAYLSGGGDLAVVPVGAVERMGRHLPLHSGVYLAEAVAEALAEAGNGLLAPVIPYSTLYDTRAMRGSVHIEPRVMHRYLYDLCVELRANGFARVLVVGAMTELYYLVCEFFENENFAPLWVDVNEIPVVGAESRDERITWLVAGALRLRGREDLLSRLAALNGQQYGAVPPSPRDDARFAMFRKFGRVGYGLACDEDDVRPVSRLDVEAGARAIKEYAESHKDALEALDEYASHVSRRRYDRGMR